MPKLVINIKTINAGTKYSFNPRGLLPQYLYSQLAVTNFPTSSTIAMIAILIALAANIYIKPMMLNHAATPAIDNAVNSVIKVKIFT